MGEEVDVTPQHLDDAGEAITGLRDGVTDSPGFTRVAHDGQAHYGMDDAGRLSGAFFDPSLSADHYLFQRSQELIDLKADLEQNLVALASALHTVADVYTSADLENAVDFAFVESDAVPEGLPDYLDPDQTYSDMRDEAEQEAEDASDHGEAGPEAGGEDERSEPLSFHLDPSGGDPMAGTRYHDADGNPVRTEYVTYHDDGSRTVRTYEGGEETSEETHSPGLDLAVNRQVSEGSDQMEQALREAGFDPDHPEDW